MRALVTGASGFLGRHLVAALVTRGDYVVGLVRDVLTRDLVPEVWPQAIVRGGFDQVERAIAEYEVDTVFHLAAQTQVSTAVRDPVGTLEANVRGTWHVLEACRRQGATVLVASSDKAYGNGPVPYREQQPLRSCGVYATSKTCADLVAQAYVEDLGADAYVVRCGNLYGPGHVNYSTLIPGTIRSLLLGERPRLRSTGSPRRDFLYVEDAVSGYLALADVRPLVGNRAFNFGTGSSLSVREVVKKVSRAVGAQVEPEHVESAVRAAEIDEQTLDVSKAREYLGWRPEHDLEAGLAKTVPWYRERLLGEGVSIPPPADDSATSAGGDFGGGGGGEAPR